MILYANGCSHTAAAEAVMPACFAIDDGRNGIDRRPHPENLAASWCTHVANGLSMSLVCEAESGGSNARIVRTTKQWLNNNQSHWSKVLVILQWTTWEREEWLHNNTWYQVNVSGLDWVPRELRQRYKNYIAFVDWTQKTQAAHTDIWNMHQWLAQRDIHHVFFNGHSTFSDISERQEWGINYMDPYLLAGSYHNWLMTHGGTYANPKSYHFDAKSHRLWAQHVLQYINHNPTLLPSNEISTD